MERRTYLQSVVSSPLLSFDFTVFKQADEDLDLYYVNACFTGIRKDIVYTYGDDSKVVESFDEYDDWMTEVRSYTEDFEYPDILVMHLSDADLRSVILKDGYFKSVFEIDEYTIKVFSGADDVESEYLVQYYSDSVSEMESFEAGSRMEIDAKLDRRNVIF